MLSLLSAFFPSALHVMTTCLGKLCLFAVSLLFKMYAVKKLSSRSIECAFCLPSHISLAISDLITAIEAFRVSSFGWTVMTEGSRRRGRHVLGAPSPPSIVDKRREIKDAGAVAETRRSPSRHHSKGLQGNMRLLAPLLLLVAFAAGDNPYWFACSI